MLRGLIHEYVYDYVVMENAQLVQKTFKTTSGNPLFEKWSDQMDTYLSISKWAISYLRGWGSERLPGWFVHFLVHFGNIKQKQMV